MKLKQVVTKQNAMATMKIYNVLTQYASHTSTGVTSYSSLEDALEDFKWSCKCVENNHNERYTKTIYCDNNKYKRYEYVTDTSTITIQMVETLLNV